MTSILLAAVLLPIFGLGYLFVLPSINKILAARKARLRGCEPPLLRHYKYPGGLDMIYRMVQADKRNQVPNEFEKIYDELNNVNTWIQYFFGHPVLMTVDPKNIQALLAIQFNDFELGPTRKGIFFPLLGNGIFTADGKYWEHSRALLRPQFARDQVSDLALEERHVQHMFLHMKSDSYGWTSELNLQPLFFRLTLDSATEFLFGESVNSQITALPGNAPEKNHVVSSIKIDLIKVANAFDRGTHALGTRARFSENYWLYNPRSFSDDCKTVHEFADFYVRRALAQNASLVEEEKGEAKQKYIFINELAKATRDPVELRSQLLHTFLAGRDSTAGLLGWTFWEFARHPEVFHKLRKIVLETFGTYENPEISFTSLKGCTYLQHVMSETLRLFPSVPVNSRRAVKDTTIPRGGGARGESPVFIPKGAQVDYCVYVMHRRKDIWGPDAGEFRPERWQGKKVGWEFLPFNGGPRICLGQQFSLTGAGYVIVRMLQKYDDIQNLDPIQHNDALHQYSITSAPLSVPVKLHEASRKS